jgi:ferritin-like metal-binding protein YciE
MKGLIEEGKDILKEGEKDSPALDAALIAAAQKVEHYEIASYGCCCTYAKMLNYEEAGRVLHETLDEEKQTDQKLTELAESMINQEAAETQPVEE